MFRQPRRLIHGVVVVANDRSGRRDHRAGAHILPERYRLLEVPTFAIHQRPELVSPRWRPVLADVLDRAAEEIVHVRLDRVSPLAVPVLLEIGREQVQGAAIDELLDEAASDLIAEATQGVEQGRLPI